MPMIMAMINDGGDDFVYGDDGDNEHGDGDD